MVRRLRPVSPMKALFLASALVLSALSSLALVATPASATCLADSDPLGVGVVCSGPGTCVAGVFGPLWYPNQNFACVKVTIPGPGIVCFWATSMSNAICS